MGIEQLYFIFYIDEPSVKIECPQAVNETETLVVSCNITEAEPAVEEEHIIWYYNEEPMNNRGKLLEVKNITRLQKGKYSCDASNIVGTSIRANCIIDIYCELFISLFSYE